VIPTVKDYIPRQGPNSIEKGLSLGQHAAKQRLLGITPRQNSREKKCSQIETEQKRCQVCRAVTKVVRKMRAFRFAHVVIFVFALPPSTTCLGALRDVLSAQAMVGDKASVIELCACFRLDDGDLAPVHGQGIRAAAQGNVSEVALPHDCRKTAIAVAAFHGFDGVIGLPKGQALLEGGMGVGLAHKDAVESVVQGPGPQRLVTVEGIAQ
jgi:hypothetical protein